MIHKQVGKNLLFNYISLFSQILTGLWLTPYLVTNLGTAAFGFIPLAGVLTEYINLITSSFNAAISRYIVLDLNRNNNDQAIITFSTSLYSVFFLLFIQIPLALFFIYNLDVFLTVPATLASDIFLLMLLSFIGFVISSISGVFSTSLYSQNRLDLIQAGNILKIFFRLLIIIIGFSFISPSLYIVGVGELFASFFFLIFNLGYWRKLSPQLRICFGQFDFTLFTEFIKLSSWLAINRLGSLLFLKVDLVVLNKFAGVLVGGKYSIILKIQELIRHSIQLFSNLSGPLVMKYYAQNNFKKMNEILRTHILVIGILTSIICGIIMGWAELLLNLWVGKDIAVYNKILLLTVCHLPLNLSVIPLFNLQMVLKRVKLPGIVTVSGGILNLLVILSLVAVFDLGMLGVAVGSGIVLSLKNLVFTPLYSSYVSGRPWFEYYGILAYTALFTVMSFGIAKLVIKFVVIDNIFSLFVAGFTAFILSLTSIVLLSIFCSVRPDLMRLIPAFKVKI